MINLCQSNIVGTKSTYFYDKLCGNTGLSPLEMEALLLIRKDKSLIICKPDKGNGVVLMNKTDYKEKMNTILSDLYEDIHKHIRPFTAVTPTLYSLPKSHKKACP